MAPGGSACKEVVESHSIIADYGLATMKAETNTTSNASKTTNTVIGKHGISTTNGVHELLECPVCTSLMYPPIHQVRFLFLVIVTQPIFELKIEM